jgi:hypothetical protein
MTHGQAVRELCTMLQRTFDHYSPVELFRDFLTACHLTLDDLPSHLHYAATGGRESITAPDSKQRWEQAMGRFQPKTLEAFAHGFAVLISAASPLEGVGWQTDSVGGPDVIGQVYTDLLTGRSNKWDYHAQFFTPWNFWLMMTKMAGAGELEARFHAQVKAKLTDDPVLQALTLASLGGGPDAYWYWLSKAWPRLREQIPPERVMGPASAPVACSWRTPPATPSGSPRSATCNTRGWTWTPSASRWRSSTSGCTGSRRCAWSPPPWTPSPA